MSCGSIVEWRAGGGEAMIERQGNVLAQTAEEMPRHEAYIARFCKAPMA